jgi:hypothetical protein
MSPYRIVTADERLAAPRSIKGVIFGPHGVGKTSLLWTLDPEKTLLVNMEAGDLCLQGWQGDSVLVRSWKDARDWACVIGGPNPALRPDQAYSQAHYDLVCEQIDPAILNKYSNIFYDSISVAGRLCWQWTTGRPEAFSEKTGKPDQRGAYGLLGKELVQWFTHIQHTRGKCVWLVGGLDEKKDDFNRPFFEPQIDGSKAALELPGIFDQVISMVQLFTEDGKPYRAFVCNTLNPWKYPAKDRSGRLDMIEKPHLGELMDKISGPVRPARERLEYHMPQEGEAA